MKKILFVIFYEAIDFLKDIKDGFNKYNFEIDVYPLFKYAYDTHSRIESYEEHMIEYISETKPDIVLWWFIDIPFDSMKRIVDSSTGPYYILYNCDDPVNLSEQIFNRAKLFDLIVTPCRESVSLYKIFSGKNRVVYLPFGYNSNIVKPIDRKTIPEKYLADISLVTNNLHIGINHNDNWYIDAKTLLQDISEYCKSKGLLFKIFGTPAVNEYFPQNYAGELPYSDLNYVYNGSKINLLIHNNYQMDMAVDNYFYTALASGGLVLIDPVKGLDNLLVGGTDCIFLQKDYISQIDEIFNKSISTSGVDKANAYCWTKWVEKIIYEYSIDNFDQTIYRELYKLADNEDAFIIWKHNFDAGNIQVCYKFNLPENFDYQKYVLDFGIGDNNNSNNDNKMSAYLDCIQNCRFQDYVLPMQTSTKVELFDPEKLAMTWDQYHYLCGIFSKIRHNSSKNDSLIELGIFAQRYPTTDIGKVLDIYISNI